MRIRLAKKIMCYNPNCRINTKQVKRFNKLRPPYTDEQGRTIYPSWHDIEIVKRAYIRLYQWIRRYEKKQAKLNKL